MRLSQLSVREARLEQLRLAGTPWVTINVATTVSASPWWAVANAELGGDSLARGRPSLVSSVSGSAFLWASTENPETWFWMFPYYILQCLLAKGALSEDAFFVRVAWACSVQDFLPSSQRVVLRSQMLSIILSLIFIIFPTVSTTFMANWLASLQILIACRSAFALFGCASFC